MRGITLVLLLLSLGLASADAETIILSDGQAPVSFGALNEPDGTIVVSCTLGRFDLVPVVIAGETFYDVLLGGESRSKAKGLPALPTVNRSLLIPDDAEMEVRILSAAYTDYHSTPVAPSKGIIFRGTDPSSVPYTFDTVYSTDGWYPLERVDCGEPYIMRDARGCLLILNPFSYNPVEQTLRVYHDIELELRPVGPGKKNVLDIRPASFDREFAREYSERFANYESSSLSHRIAAVTDGEQRYPKPGETGGMLVVCHESFVTAMQPLVEWKKQTGVPCELVTVTEAGSSPAAIASFIQSRYYSDGLSYVLLVGDYTEVPTNYVGTGASDPTYALVAGSDLYPDLFVGRFSAESVADVETQVERTIEYEREPEASAAWYSQGTGIASSQGPGDDDEYDDDHMDLIRDDLLGYTYVHVDQMYHPYATASGVTQALNDGRGIVNYTGHGSVTSWSTSGFNSTHVDALTNDGELPFIFSVACYNGKFNGYTCFGESWLRATNDGEPSGAIGAYMSSIGQSWDPPMDAQDEFVDLLVTGRRATYGGLCYGGSGHMMDEYPITGPSEFQAWHIFGDPSLKVRTDAPHYLSVTHDSEVEPASPSVEVSVVGVEGALCALYAGGVLYGSALTDASGTAVIDVDPPLPADDEVTLTVTALNAFPYVETISVLPAHTPILDIDRDSVSVSLEPGGSTSETLQVSNVGDPLSTLHFTAAVVNRDEPLNRSDWSVSVSPDSFAVGSMFDLEFSVSNESSDDVRIDDIALDFPAGAIPFTATAFVAGGDSLAWDGVNGDGATLTWSAGEGHGLERGASASATISVLMSSGFTGDMGIVYSLSGGVGDERSGSVYVKSAVGRILTIDYPATGEFLRVGEPSQIEWTTGGAVDEVAFDFSYDGGATWVAVASGIANTGSHTWTVPNAPSSNCLVRIISTSGVLAEAASEGAFIIYEPVSWLTLSAESGSVPHGDVESIVLDVDAFGLDMGEHVADVVFDGIGLAREAIPVTLTVEENVEIPERLSLYGNHPNPFTPGTTISFGLPARGRATVSVYDVSGRLVRTVADEVYDEGRQHVSWDGRDSAGENVASGVYFCRVEHRGTARNSKMLLIH